MRFLRLLTNCLIGGLLVAAQLAVLFLHLNPHFPLQPAALAALGARLVLLYGVHAAVLFYLVVAARQLVATEPFSPGWLSLRVLAWLGAAATGAAAAVMWLNVQRFSPLLDELALGRMVAATLALTVVAAALLTLAVVHYSFARRGNWVSALLLMVALVLSVALPVALRGPGASQPLAAFRLDVAGWTAPSGGAARVVLIAIDGASLEYIVPAVAEGRLPEFARLLDGGASLHLATLRPTQPAPVWATVATGKYPSKHGIRSAAVYALGEDRPPLGLLPDLCFAHALVYFGLLTEHPVTSASLAAQPLWSMLSRFGVSVGVVGWPLTYPAQPVRGYLVSDRVQPGALPLLGAERAAVVYPTDVLDLIESSVVTDLAEDERDAKAWLVGERPDTGSTRVPTGRDRVYGQIAALLQTRDSPRFVTVRYQGLDAVAHWDLPARTEGQPATLVAVGEGDRGRTLAQYYRYLDREIGTALAALGPDDLLLVVSGFGMAPTSYAKRLLARLLGEAEQVGTHENAPDGFLLAYGSAVEPGRLPRGSIADVAPTILYFLGAPVGRDFDGAVRSDLFRRAFTASRPITYIPTYER